MTALASDNFDTNGANLGANWTDIDAGWSVVTQQALTSGGAAVNLAKYSAVAWPADQWAQVVMGSTIEPFPDGGPGPALRCASGAASDAIFISCGTDSRVWKRIGGSSIQLGSSGPAVVTGDVIYLEVKGNRIIAKKNGAFICGTPLTDGGLPASGSAGLFGYSENDANADSWSGGNFVPDKMGRRIYVLP